MRYFLVFVLALSCFWSGELEARPNLVLEDGGIAVPRFAEGDLDGDGSRELVVGGRVGGFRPVTDPIGVRTARVEVYAANGGWMELRAASEGLNVVNDLAVGDLDGDGRAEVVAVGEYRISVLAYRDGRLEVEWTEGLATGRFLRVDCADLDGDDRAEVVIAEESSGFGEEVRGTQIRIYRFADGWEELNVLALGLHVGDLCVADFDGDGRIELALEQGGEEVGGQVSVYDLAEGQIHERFSQQVTRDQVRALSLAAVGLETGAWLGVGHTRGQVGLWQLRGERFSLVDELTSSGGLLRGLHLTRLFDLPGVQVLSGVAGRGARGGQVWMVEGPQFQGE